MAASKVSLKLLIDTTKNKVLFAEAGKDFVDFLFNLLSLPVATVIRLLTKSEMIGCLGNVYVSVQNLGDIIRPNQTKDFLLNPKVFVPSSTHYFPLLLQQNNNVTMSSPKLFMCSNKKGIIENKMRGKKDKRRFGSSNNGRYCCVSTVSDDPMIQCPSCNRFTMTREVNFVSKSKDNNYASSSSIVNINNGVENKGFVKEVVTYMVMDDLVVSPMSTISSITILNKFNVKEVASLKEKMVHIGMPEGIKILKASLQSKMVLTSVFLEQPQEGLEEGRRRRRLRRKKKKSHSRTCKS